MRRDGGGRGHPDGPPRLSHHGVTVRVDLTPYAVAAFVVVVGLAVAAAGLAEVVSRWATGLVRRSPAVAAVGLTLLVITAVNTLVARTCGPPPGSRNRPLLAAFADGDCRSEAILQLALVPVVAVALTVVVRIVARRRRHPHADELAGRQADHVG